MSEEALSKSFIAQIAEDNRQTAERRVQELPTKSANGQPIEFVCDVCHQRFSGTGGYTRFMVGSTAPFGQTTGDIYLCFGCAPEKITAEGLASEIFAYRCSQGPQQDVVRMNKLIDLLRFGWRICVPGELGLWSFKRRDQTTEERTSLREAIDVAPVPSSLVVD